MDYVAAFFLHFVESDLNQPTKNLGEMLKNLDKLMFFKRVGSTTNQSLLSSCEFPANNHVTYVQFLLLIYATGTCFKRCM